MHVALLLKSSSDCVMIRFVYFQVRELQSVANEFFISEEMLKTAFSIGNAWHRFWYTL